MRSFARGHKVLAALFLAIGTLAACAPYTDLPGRAVEQPRLTTETFVASDGTKLPIQHWGPNPSTPRAIILGIHGMNDYANAFAIPAAWWAKRDIATFAYDQRGFGRSPHPGYWPGEAALAADLDGVVGALRAKYPGIPLFVLGESMGGAVAIAAFARADHPKIDGLILAAPAVWGRETMDLGKRLALWFASRTVPWLRVTGQGLKITPSDNREMLIALGRDPLVIKETRIDAIWGLVNLMDDAFADAPKLDGIPILMLYGERDQIIPKEPTRLMIDHLPPFPTAPRTIAIYPKGYHMLLRDLEAHIVWQDVLHWMDDPKAPLPSGADKTGLSAIAGG